MPCLGDCHLLLLCFLLSGENSFHQLYNILYIFLLRVAMKIVWLLDKGWLFFFLFGQQQFCVCNLQKTYMELFFGSTFILCVVPSSKYFLKSSMKSSFAFILTLEFFFSFAFPK